MGIINRVFCFVFSLAVLVIAVAFLLTACGVVAEDVFFNNLKFLLRQKETPAVIGFFAFFAFYFLCVSYFSGEKKQPTLKELPLGDGKGGQVSVSVEAVKNLAERVALGVGNVREAAAFVSSDEKRGVKVKLELVVLTGVNVPQVSAEVIGNVKSELNSALSVLDADVGVSVTEISNNGAAKRVF